METKNKQIINKSEALFHLSEVLEELGKLTNFLNGDDKAGFEVKLKHIIKHLTFLTHSFNLTNKQIKKLNYTECANKIKNSV